MPSSAAKAQHLETQPIELRNIRGDRVSIMPLGGILREWEIAVGSGEPVNIILGYLHARSYLKDTAFHGAIAGRYCNRIAQSQFSIGDNSYTLAANEGQHHLHGGPEGFNRRTWTVEEQGGNHLVLSLLSPHGDQGYPGNLKVTVRYTLDDEGALNIDWHAISDTDTVVSLTSHGYFNLAGSGDILDHHLRIPAAHYTPVDSELIPTGEIRSVEGTVLDLRQFTRLGDVLTSEDSEIQTCDGLDHNWAGGVPGEMQLRAELVSTRTKLLLAVSSTLPGLQCYTGNHLQGNGIHGCHEGVCLEPQHYPDSPNQPNFPSPLLRAGDAMRHRIRYQISKVDTDRLLERH
jgi:aldose 1-epimerase